MNDMRGLYETSERSNTPVSIQDYTLTSRVYLRVVTHRRNNLLHLKYAQNNTIDQICRYSQNHTKACSSTHLMNSKYTLNAYQHEVHINNKNSFSY